MDQSDPWSSYGYNRVTMSGAPSISTTTTSSDFHQHQLVTVAGPAAPIHSSVGSTILLQTPNTGGATGTFNAAGYVTTPVSYDTVFNPVFPHTGQKSGHSSSSSQNTPHRQSVGQIQVLIPEKAESPRQGYTNQSHPQVQPSQQENFYSEHPSIGEASSPTTSVPTTGTLNWQGNNSHLSVADPFAILSQESVVTNNTNQSGQTNKVNNYETYYISRTENIGQISGIKNISNTRSSSPQVCNTKTIQHSVPSPITVSVASSGTQIATQFYRQPLNISPAYSDSSVQTGNLQHTMTTASQTASNKSVGNQQDNRPYVATKKLNMFNNATRNTDKNRSLVSSSSPITLVNNITNTNTSNFGVQTSIAKTNNHAVHLVQTKAQSKVYPELLLVEDVDKANIAQIQEDGSIQYYALIDRRLTDYATTGNANIIINEPSKGGNVANIHNPRHFVVTNSTEIITSDAGRIRTEPTYAIPSIQNECTNAIIVPRKQSPSHSSSSQVPSPAYPIYNSPMNPIESPSQQNSSGTHASSDGTARIVIYKSNTPTQAQIPQIPAQSPLDTPTVTRNLGNNSLSNTSGQVIYSSVITRAMVNEQAKIYNASQTCWDADVKPKKYYTINSAGQNEIVVPAGIELKQTYYDPTTAHNTQIGALHDLKTEDQVTENILVTTEHPLASQIQITPKIEEQNQPPPPIPPPKTRRKRNQNSTKTREQLLSENEFLINRVPSVVTQSSKCAAVTEIPAGLTIQQISQPQVIQQQPPSQQENDTSFFEFDNRWTTQNSQKDVTQSNIPAQIVSYTPSLQQLQQQQTQQLSQQPQQTHLLHHSHTQELVTTQQTNQNNQSPQAPYFSTFITHNSPVNVPQSITTTNTSVALNPSSDIQEVSLISQQSGQTISNNSGELTVSSPAPCSNTNSIVKESKQSTDEAGIKVVVPNIEEELEFLSTNPSNSKQTKNYTITPNFITYLRNPSTEDNKIKPVKIVNSIGTGFMASYLKFLQGERENSPPPSIGRIVKSPLYQRNPPTTSIATKTQNIAVNSHSTATSIKTEVQSKISPQSATSTVISGVTNNIIPIENHINATKVSTTIEAEQKIQQRQVSQISHTTGNIQTESSNSGLNVPQNEKKQNSSDNEMETKQRQKGKRVAEIAVQTSSHPVLLPKKARPQMAMQMASMKNQIVTSIPPQTTITTIGFSSDQEQTNVITNNTNNVIINTTAPTVLPVQSIQRQSSAPTSTYRQRQQHKLDEDPLNLPPRREMSLRKAKARGIEEIMQKKSQYENDDPDEPQEFADSDTDPVWTPQEEENEGSKIGKTGKRKTKKSKTSYSRSRKQCSNILTAAVVGAGIDDSDADHNVEMGERLETTKEIGKKQINLPKRIKREVIKTQEVPLIQSTDELNFKVGDFIIHRSELYKEWPVIWQVDRKSILQMYESFYQDGKTLYKNMSKYATWNDNKKQYVKAPVYIHVQNQSETIIELIKSELEIDDDQQFLTKVMQDYLIYRENFEVYLQTLISQSLDRNFFAEITREKDEYFLSNIKVIDDIITNCKQKLLSAVNWSKTIILSIETWPLYNVIRETGHNHITQVFCAGCRQTGISARLVLYGQPYDSSTVVTISPDPKMNYEKDIPMCQICIIKAEIFHKISHEKYNLYQICTKKVQEQHSIDPEKGTTAILNDLLADSNWVDQLFNNIRQCWAEVENLEPDNRSNQASQ